MRNEKPGELPKGTPKPPPPSTPASPPPDNGISKWVWIAVAAGILLTIILAS